MKDKIRKLQKEREKVERKLWKAAWKGDVRKAEKILEEYLRKNPDDKEALLALTRILAETKPEKAMRILDKALEKWPNDPEIIRQKVILLLNQGKIEEAEKIIAGIKSENPEIIEAKALITAEKDPRKAIEIIDKALAKKEDSALRLTKARILAEELKKYEEAEEEIKKAMKMGIKKGEKSTALTLLAYVKWKQGKFEEAEKYARKAIEINPLENDAWRILAEALLELERYEEADACIDRALAIAPNSFYANKTKLICILEIARKKYSEKDVIEAANKLLKLAKTRDQLNTALWWASTAFDAIGELDKAEELAREYVRLFPNDVEAWIHLASILLSKKDVNGALSCLEKAKMLGGENSYNYWCIMAEVMEALGQINEAIKCVKKRIRTASSVEKVS